tara:strand:+ start:12385 stop:13014 length:630 start_codon:yes stop_codon:yes gene_type:complete
MSFKIEKLTKKHARFLFKLRNDHDSRKFSKNKKKLSYKEHLNWLESSLKNKNFRGFIFFKNSNKVAYVRFKIKNSKVYVSIALSKKYRNKGFSKEILLIAEKKIKNKTFYSYVNINNVRSISLFRSLNYYKYKKFKNFLIMKKNKSKNNSKKYLLIINKIEKIRKKNNSNWMDLLRIAFKHSPEESGRIMKNIYQQDNKISLLSKKLSK